MTAENRTEPGRPSPAAGVGSDPPLLALQQPPEAFDEDSLAKVIRLPATGKRRRGRRPWVVRALPAPPDGDDDDGGWVA